MLACSTRGVSTVASAPVAPSILQNNSPSPKPWQELPAGWNYITFVAGADRNMWSWASNGSTVVINRITPSTLQIQSYAPPVGPGQITLGPDGNIWWCAFQDVGFITPGGSVPPSPRGRTAIYGCRIVTRRN
jgi:hypothetical protein